MRATVCHVLQQYSFGTAACFFLCFMLPGPCYTPVRSGEYRQDESDLGKVLAVMKSDKAYEVQHAIESLLAVEKWRVAAIPHNELIRYQAVVSLVQVAPHPNEVVAPLTGALNDEDPDVKSRCSSRPWSCGAGS